MYSVVLGIFYLMLPVAFSQFSFSFFIVTVFRAEPQFFIETEYVNPTFSVDYIPGFTIFMSSHFGVDRWPR